MMKKRLVLLYSIYMAPDPLIRCSGYGTEVPLPALLALILSEIHTQKMVPAVG